MDHSRSPRRFAARSRPRLVLGGLAAAAGMTLTACDTTPEFQPAEFTSVAACTSAGFPDDLCRAGYESARSEHASTAPRFQTRSECEQEWGTGQCAAQLAGAGSDAGGAVAGAAPSATGNVFVPAIAGFMLSQALQRRYYDRGGIGPGYYGGYGGTPIYRDRTGTPVRIDRSGGRAVATPVNVNTRTVATRGFGGMGMSRSASGSRSWGG